MSVELSRRGDLRPLPREDLDRPFLDVARTLLGCLLVREEVDDRRTVVRIVETEGYVEDDPASHSHRGRTPANATMFGPPGHAYVYFTYGMHHCVNVTCGTEGGAAAVLLRAAVVLEGLDEVRARRPAARRDADLAAGPARLTEALAIDRAWDGVDLCAAGSDLWLARDEVRVPATRTRRGPRVGIRHAADQPWRLWVDGVPAVSTYRRHPKAPPSARG